MFYFSLFYIFAVIFVKCYLSFLYSIRLYQIKIPVAPHFLCVIISQVFTFFQVCSGTGIKSDPLNCLEEVGIQCLVPLKLQIALPVRFLLMNYMKAMRLMCFVLHIIILETGNWLRM